MRKNIRIKGKLFDLNEPRIMGIVNITPDSFYEGSRAIQCDEIIDRVNHMINSGAAFIDVGACSTRPGSKMVDEKTELMRLESALNCIRKNFPDLIISIDTFRSSIAEWCIQNFEVDIINDIGGGELDSRMFEIIAKYQVPYILMHMRGNPESMQNFTQYNQVTQDVIYELSKKIYFAREAGINDIIIDPGFGFSKTLEQNYELLSQLEYLHIFDLPILVGLSRKSMIYKLLNIGPEDALNGTTALNMIALLKGANILRVHDVKEASETIKIWKQLQVFNKQ